MSDIELKLYDHNIKTYENVISSFNSGEKKAAIVHATGTGKTYIALKLALENRDKSFLFVAPTNAIIEHIKETLSNNNLKLNNIKFRTYSSLIEKHEGELASIKADYIVLDEIHHLGAPVWGENVRKLVDTHPASNVLGMSAYTVRDRGTSQERDVTNPETDEVFSGKVIDTYSIVDAMYDRVLPKPIYKTAYLNLKEEEKIIEEKLLRKNQNNEDYEMLMSLLGEAKRQIENAPSIKDIIKKNLKKDGKYIYFCPPVTNESVSNLESIKAQALEWFKGVTEEENIVIYTTTSEMGAEGKLNRDAFYNDTDLEGNDAKDKLRVMFAINQYNEGVHAPNVDGVIMGRQTSSDIVFFEQLGRALSVNENTKERIDKYMTYSLRQLREECTKRDIVHTDYDTEEILINKLTSPIIIDLVNNYEYIKELENNLRNKIIEESSSNNKTALKLKDATFDIEVESKNIHETLEYVIDRLNLTWEDYYEYASKYYENHNDLEVPSKFRTNDGYTYDDEGFLKLGNWIRAQRVQKRDNNLSTDKIESLNEIGMRWDNIRSTLDWDTMYNYLVKYNDYYKTTNVPRRFKTNDGINSAENGTIRLGNWVSHQRDEYSKGRLSEERQNALKKLNFRFTTNIKTIPFDQMVEYLILYKEHNGDLNVPYEFKTNDGYTYDENGSINLGVWLSHRKADFYKQTIKKERLDKLKSIGVEFDMSNKKKTWDEMYNIAVDLFNQTNNIDVPKDYVFNDENIGAWISLQIQAINAGTITPDKLHKLELLNIRTKKKQLTWEESFEIAKEFSKTNNIADITYEYKTPDGYSLGRWKARQKNAYKKGELSEDRINALKSIGFDFSDKVLSWDEAYENAKEFYKLNNTIDTKKGDKLPNTDFDIHKWILNQRNKYKNNELSEDQIKLLDELNMRWEPSIPKRDDMLTYAKNYFNKYGNLLVKRTFRTKDGITFDEDGNAFGRWIQAQRFKCQNNMLSDKEKIELDLCGMIWNINKNIESKKSVVNMYGIDYEKNKMIIDKTPSQILEAKILYLLDNNLPLKNTDNSLNEIFYLSNEELKQKYNISVEDILNNYYITKRGR